MSDKQKFINRYKDLYRVKKGKDLSDSEALHHFEKLTTLVGVLFKPFPINLLLSGKCPVCQNEIDITRMANEDKKELLISGLCKSCQDQTFKTI
jgi:hypothetical protein